MQNATKKLEESTYLNVITTNTLNLKRNGAQQSLTKKEKTLHS